MYPNKNYNETTIYEQAFDGESGAIWLGTKFENELAELSYYRALTCWIRNNDEGERDRRRLLYSYLSDVFSTKNADDTLNKMFSTLPSDNTYITRALRNLCILYNEAPSRYYEGLSETQELALNGYITECNYNKVMQDAYRICKLMNRVLIRPYKINGVLKLKIYTPDLYRAAYDDYGNITEVWIPRQERYLDGGRYKNRTIYDVWDGNRYRKLDYHGSPLVFVYNNQKYTELIFNKYTAPPFYEMSLDSDADVYGGGLWELVKAQLEANLWDLLIKENAIYNGFSVWMLVNLGRDNDNKLSPGRMFRVDGVTDTEGGKIPPYIETISPNQQYTEMNEMKTERVKALLRNIGLPSSVIEGRDVSGVAMLVDRAELNEIRKEDLSILKQHEIGLHRQIIQVLNVEFKESLPVDIKFTVDYIEPTIYREPKDEYEYYKSLYDSGYMDIKTFLYKITGDESIITEEDAIGYIKNNLRIRNETQQYTTANGRDGLSNGNESASGTIPRPVDAENDNNTTG